MRTEMRRNLLHFALRSYLRNASKQRHDGRHDLEHRCRDAVFASKLLAEVHERQANQNVVQSHSPHGVLLVPSTVSQLSAKCQQRLEKILRTRKCGRQSAPAWRASWAFARGSGGRDLLGTLTKLYGVVYGATLPEPMVGPDFSVSG